MFSMMIDIEEKEPEIFFPNKNLFFSSFEYNTMEDQDKFISNEFNYEYLEKKKEPEAKYNDQNLLKTTDSLNPSKLISSVLPKMEIAKIEFSVPESKFCLNISDNDSTKHPKFTLTSMNTENKVNFSSNLSGVKKLPSTNFNFKNHNLKPFQLRFKNDQNKNQSIFNDESNLNCLPPTNNKNGIPEKKENGALKSYYIPKTKCISNQSFLSKNEKIQNQNFKDETVQELKERNKKFEFSEKEKNYLSILPKNHVCKFEKKKFEFTLTKSNHMKSELRNLEENKYTILETFRERLEKISENSENEETFQISKDEFYNYPEVNKKEKSSIKKKENSLERKELFNTNLSEKENANYQLQSPLNNKNFDTYEQTMNKESLRKEMIDVQFVAKINESKLVLDHLEKKIFERKMFQADLNGHLASCVYLHNYTLEKIENIIAEHLYFLSEPDGIIDQH